MLPNMPDTLTIALVAAAFAGVAAIAGIATAFIIHQGNKRQLRAYLKVEPNMKVPGGTNAPLVFDLEIKNCGQTPAYKLVSFCSIDFKANPFTDFPPRPEDLPPDPPAYLPPGAELTLHGKVAQPRTAQQRADFKSGKSSLYLWGEIKYKDVFGKKRFVKFKWEYGKQAAKNKSGPTICPDGNDAN
jgi:hypothetical protein